MNLVQLFTTENKALIFIIKILVLAIEGFFFYKNAEIVFNISFSKKQKILFLLVVVITGTFTDFIPDKYVLLQDILNVLSIILALKYFLRQSIIKSVIILVISYFEAFLSGCLSQVIINIFNLNSNHLISIPIYYLITNDFFIICCS